MSLPTNPEITVIKLPDPSVELLPVIQGKQGPQGPVGPAGPPGQDGNGATDPGDLTLIFDNQII